MPVSSIRVVGALLLLAVGGCGLIPTPSPSADLDFVFNLAESRAPIEVSGSPELAVTPIFDQLPGYLGHHAATITAFADGELLAAWYSYPGDEELSGSAIFMSRRAADAAAWETPHLHIDRTKADGNPVLYSEGDHVWLFQSVVPFGWDTAHIESQQSADRGQTWTDPTILTKGLGTNTRYPPVRLADGTLLLPAYDELVSRSIFFESIDGNTWSLRSNVASRPGSIQPSVVTLANGRLLAVMRNTKESWLWTMASDDNGQTWTEPRDSGFPNPGSAAALLRLANGHLILIYNDSPTDRNPLTVALSADEGQTCPAKKILATGESTYSYPSAIQSPDGRIHVVYSQAREAIMHAAFNEAWIVSDN